MIEAVMFVLALVVISVFGSKGDVADFSKAYKERK